MMTNPKIDEETITGELVTLWNFLQNHVDWEEARKAVKHVSDTYDGISQRLDGMGYDEKLMIHALVSLGALMGHALAPSYMIIMRNDEDIISEGELN